MNRPKMILFDYGGTLLYEPKFDLLRGERAVFRYIKENPQNVTPEQAHSHDKELFENADKCRAMGYECHEWPLFRIALNKAGLSPEEVWYCGDSIQPDVFGAHGAGIFPVLYQGEFPEELERTLRAQPPGEIDFPYLHIRDWREMISVLEKC